MDKYKDFRDLEDTKEETLKNLFLHRTYEKYIDDPLADDIIVTDVSYISEWIHDRPLVKFVDPNHERKPSTYEERMEIKSKNYSAGYTFGEINEFEVAKFELDFLNPLEIENRYLRKRVEAYRDLCQQIVDRSMGTKYSKADWTELFSQLVDIYIENISLNDFIEIMTYYRLPMGKGKIKWIGKKSDLMYVERELGFPEGVLNKCFDSKNGTPFKPNNRRSKAPSDSLLGIIRRHKQK